MNIASIQFDKMKKKIIQLNKKLEGAYNFQNRLSKRQKQLTLAKQDVLEVHDKLN